jgi:virginiamycin B lyase
LPSAITEYPLPAGDGPPSSLTVGPDGDLWFIEESSAGSGAIGRITPAGDITEFPLQRSNFIGISGLTVGPNGNLWFGLIGNSGAPGGIGRITPGGAITEFSVSNSPLSGPLTVGPDDNLWFIESTPDEGADGIGRITPAGNLTEFPLPAGHDSAGDLTVGPDGNLWLKEDYYGPFDSALPGKIDRITPAGAFTQYTVSGAPGDLKVGPDGNLWFTEGGVIGRITPSGAITQFAVPSHKYGRYASSDLTAGPDGNLWFTVDVGFYDVTIKSEIGRITPSGAITQFPLRASYYSQSVLTAGPDGNFWVIATIGNDNKGKIARITPAGAVTVFPFPPGTNPTPYFHDLIVGPDGNLWFTAGAAIGRVDLAPRVTNVTAVAHSTGAITTILLRFDETLDPASASRFRLYGLAAGLERGQRIVFGQKVKIARVSYDRAAHMVRLKLAVPQKGPLQVTVRAGLKAADGMTSSSDYTAVVT